jgi:hypothetical protein
MSEYIVDELNFHSQRAEADERVLHLLAEAAGTIQRLRHPKQSGDTKLAALILEYARDMRRNSSGSDDYPWEWAKATADYLEELVRRSGVTINMNHAVLSENAQMVMLDRGPDWVPDNPHIAAMFKGL